MLIPLQDPKRQYLALKSEIDDVVSSILDSGQYLLGAMTSEFEREFGRFCQSKYCISVANGTDALEIALKAVGCGIGSEIINVANAGGYTTTACRLIGAIPVYVDIELQNLTLNIPSAVAAVTDNTKAIVVTHLYGNAVDVLLLRKELDGLGRSDIAIIEDCAQAHGAVINEKPVGSLGTIGTFSFYPTKNLGALGDGGAIVCQEESIAERVKALRQYGWEQRYISKVKYGRNSRLDEIQAAILLKKLPYLGSWNERRRLIIEAYRQASSGFLRIPGFNNSRSVAHLCVALHEDRNWLCNSLEEVGIMTGIHYPLLDTEQPSESETERITHDLSNTKNIINKILTLPCFPELTDLEIDYVCQYLSKLANFNNVKTKE